LLPGPHPAPPGIVPPGLAEPGRCAPLTDAAPADAPARAGIPAAPPGPPAGEPAGYRWYGAAEFLCAWTNRGPALDDGQLVGGRVTLGRWLGGGQHVGAEGTYLHLAPAEEGGRLWSGEVNLRRQLGSSCWHHLDVLCGFRALGFDEGLSRTDPPAGDGVPDGSGARNLFLGGQVGAEAELHYGRWYTDVWGKVALGNNREVVNLGGPSAVGDGGRQGRDELACVPEAAVQVGCQVANHLRLFAGYDVLYLPNVVRPAPDVRDSDVWVQGVNLGLEFRY
jgi:hypothetical protein